MERETCLTFVNFGHIVLASNKSLYSHYIKSIYFYLFNSKFWRMPPLTTALTIDSSISFTTQQKANEYYYPYCRTVETPIRDGASIVAQNGWQQTIAFCCVCGILITNHEPGGFKRNSSWRKSYHHLKRQCKSTTISNVVIG